MVKKSSSKTQKKNEETGQPESTKRVRDRVDEFLAKRSDFSKRGGHVSLVIGRGSLLKEDHKSEDDEE